jgi:hypothetical protein
MTAHVPRLMFSLDPLMAEAKRRARQRRLLLAVVALLTTVGALGAVFAMRSSSGPAGAGAQAASRQISGGLVNCRRGVPSLDFQVFACMSGGARTGRPHPKELLVVRNDGSSVAYPDFGGQVLGGGYGEVLASYHDSLVRVTGRQLVPLVTQDGLASALHNQKIRIMGFGHLRVNTLGDVFFSASTLIRGRHGCQNRYLERLADGTIRQISASSSPPSNICY